MGSGGNAATKKTLEAQEAQRRLSKEELLQPRIREEAVEINGLGGTVVLRSMSYEVRTELRKRCGWGNEEAWDEDQFTVLSIVHSVVDPKLTEEDIDQLKKQDQGVFDEFVLKIGLLNMMGRTPSELKKESPTTGNSDSVSG